ncbi:protein disulfide isomerase [Tieghemostelium lacteum]|uniref:Protein disulfide-isomerase n=1 Tax=Tieghemostelium lacteum TaxID=361077 RepID=A0A152A206_TIELA|nr:protein disulfide isomerase [Tieghemostelium lacteum]|eukprot:KYR00125.1 protein disulfide isomerase [Tieghemostelium lacteum]
MNSKVILLLILGLLVLNVVRSHPGHSHPHGGHDSDEEDEDSKVAKLTEDTFQEFVTEHDLVLIKFYAPWCGHCKKLAPDYKKLAEKLYSQEKIGIAKVDCTEEEDLCQAHRVQGYPTLILYNKGVPEPYEGGRKLEEMATYLQQELLPPVEKLETQEDVDAFIKANELAFVGHFSNDHDDRYTTFLSVVSKNKRNLRFGAVVKKDQPELEAGKVAAGFIYKSFDDPKVAFEGEWAVEELNNFVAVNIVPMVGEINGKTYKKYENLPVPLGYLFINADQDNKKTLDDIKAVVEQHKGKIIVCTVDMKKFGQQATYMGLTGKVIPALSIENDPHKYVFDESKEFTKDNVQTFIEEILSGKAEPFVKSEPIPESNDKPVKVIVGKTYSEIALDTTKDVFIEFYAPWCGHCKSLEPIYNQLGEYLKSVPSVVIAKVDATANDVPKELNIKGFPTLLLFKSSDKANPIPYNGMRDSYQSLAKFVHENAGIEFELPSPLAEVDVEDSDLEAEPIKTTDKKDSKKSKDAKHDEL